MSRFSKLTVVLVAIVAILILIGISTISNVAEAGGGGESFSVEIVVPQQVLVGQKFDVKVILTNTFLRPIRFSGIVFIDGAAATPDDQPVVSTGEAVRIPELDGWRFFWSGGIVRNGEKVTFTLPMIGGKTGKYDFARVKLIATIPQELVITQKTLTVVEPSTPSPTATPTPAPKPVVFKLANSAVSTIEVGSSIDLFIILDSQGQETTKAQAFLHYDPRVISVKPLKGNCPFDKSYEISVGYVDTETNQAVFVGEPTSSITLNCVGLAMQITGLMKGSTTLTFHSASVAYDENNNLMPSDLRNGQITVKAKRNHR